MNPFFFPSLLRYTRLWRHREPHANLLSTQGHQVIFGSAEGQIARATHIGSMPVIARASDGSLVRFAFTNVLRCVLRFKYTLLSVKSLWKEQNIDARFRDLDHLEFPASSGGITIPYDSTLTLSTLVLVSDTDSTSSSARPMSTPCTPSNTAQHALLGFHAIKSTAHIARMSAAQASETMHRRTHSGVNTIRAFAHTTVDAPRNLTSAPKHTCVHCAAAHIRKASHSGHLDTPAAEPATGSPPLRSKAAQVALRWRRALEL